MSAPTIPFELHARTCSRQGKVKESLYGLVHPGYDRRMIELRCTECNSVLYRIGDKNWENETTSEMPTPSVGRTSK